MDKSGLPNVCDIFDTIVTDAMSLEWKTQILENRNSWIAYLKGWMRNIDKNQTNYT